MSVSVLMVAEKPSICTSIAQALSRGTKMETRGRTPPVHEFKATFMGKPAFFRVTSVTGHVFSTDFPPQYQSWDAVDPIDLFCAPILHAPEGKGGIVKHLEREAKGMDYLVLWLDCDREGENICFEVIRCVKTAMKLTVTQNSFPGKGTKPHHGNEPQRIFRAHFSAVTPKDIEKAMKSLGYPNENESKAVDARQELDLKIGVAFSRFQTRYFQGKYGNLDSAVISYGPCQTPTLGFCVDRYDEIQSFKSKPYYCIDVSLEVRGRMLALSNDRGRIFERGVVDNLIQQLSSEKEVRCQDIKTSEGKKTRPQPLNTVEMLKLASKGLGIGPQSAMRAAEHLYLSGYLSYPRTESTAYPSSFDFREVLQSQRSHPDWGSYAGMLLSQGHHKARAGHDAGDHPPITPVSLAMPHELSSDNQRIYELVVRHFLATISPDAVFLNTRAKFVFPGCGEQFTLRGKKEISPGFLQIYRGSGGSGGSGKDDEDEDDEDGEGGGGELMDLPDLDTGKLYRVASCKPRQGATTAPGYLTESDLISRMEKHGIGTDASIPTHINNITVRNYVTLGSGRTLVPTELGIVLVHGYQRIDPHLVLPDTRAAIEASCDRIARGSAAKEHVLAQALATFENKFAHFRVHIGQMDSLFEATFSPLAATGKNMGKCGRCLRYMRYIPMRPQRLHCPTCKETYGLPQNGTIKLYKELKCPLDQFELVLFSLGNTAKAQGKSYPLCPCCYNQPPVFLSNEQVQDAAARSAALAAESEAAAPSTAAATRTSIAAAGAGQPKSGGEIETVFAGLKVAADTSAAKSNKGKPTAAPASTPDVLSGGGKGHLLTLEDIEDHNGVKIRRRVKEGVGSDGEGEGGKSATSTNANANTNANTETNSSKPAAADPNPKPGRSGRGGGGGRDGRGGGGRGRGGRGGGRGRGGRGTHPEGAANQQGEQAEEGGDVLENDEEDGMAAVLKSMGCNSCQHPSCKQSAAVNGICQCPGADDSGRQCKGTLVLDVNSKPNWKLACNQCNTLIRFHGEIHNMTPQPKVPCPECGVKTMVFEFNKLKSPLPGGATTHVGCVVCDEFLNSITEVVVGRTVNLQVIRQERHRRGANGRGGRGRGRGGRGGRGAGRGGGRKGDVKMSFSDF